MIDSVALTWGHALTTSSRRPERPRSGRKVEPLSPPVRLDFPELVERLGCEEGQVRSIRYGDTWPVFAHWQVGAVELLYREGRVELRASLPKLLTGRNDTVLDERGVHDGLRELVRVGRELTRHPLELREAVPTRLDYAWQWDVPSVAFVLEHLKASFHPARKLRTENVSPKGGRSFSWGYGSQRVLRFYDKVGELRARGEETDRELDTLLRYEIQERRRQKLRLVHEHGYRAGDVRHELEHAIASLATVSLRDFRELLDTYGSYPHRVAYALGSLYLVDHDEFWPVLRKVTSKSTIYRWRKRANRAAAIAVGDFDFHIPPHAFDSGESLWTAPAAA